MSGSSAVDVPRKENEIEEAQVKLLVVLVR